MSLRPVTLWGLATATVTAGFAALLYNRLPQSIPIHWGLDGRANGFLDKPFGPFIHPVVIAGIALLGTVLPALAPRGFGVTGFSRAFDLIVLALIGFVAFIALAIDAEAFGLPVSTNHLIGVALGILVIAIGNVMGKTRRNFFIGFRTPWTLASEEVWSRTHRFGGRLLVVCGLMFCAAAALGAGLAIPLITTLAACLATVVYSRLIYRGLGPEA
jgi:uncharacterized membrane protein